MTQTLRDFIRRRGPGLLVLLVLLVGFVAFMFSRGGLKITAPTYEGLSPHRNKAKGTVTKVFDGDTIKVNLSGKDKSVHVRLMGIDCPESKRNDKCKRDGEEGWLTCDEQIPLGKRAKQKAKKILSDESIVLLSGTNEGFKQGPHNRGIAYVQTEKGMDFGLEMLKRGQCRDYSDAFDHPRMETYKKHQRPVKPINNGDTFSG